MYLSSSPFNLVDVACLRGYWTLKITRLDIVRGGGVRAKQRWCAREVGWCAASTYHLLGSYGSLLHPILNTGGCLTASDSIEAMGTQLPCSRFRQPGNQAYPRTLYCNTVAMPCGCLMLVQSIHATKGEAQFLAHLSKRR